MTCNFCGKTLENTRETSDGIIIARCLGCGKIHYIMPKSSNDSKNASKTQVNPIKNKKSSLETNTKNKTVAPTPLPSEDKSKSKRIKKTSPRIYSSLSGSGSSNSKIAINPPTSHEKSIIIHSYSLDELKDITPVIDKLRKDYPELVSERMTALDILKKAFPSKLTQRCIIRNQTYSERNKMGETFLVPRVDLYINDNNQINSKLDKNQRLLFSGKVKQGEFYVDDIKVIDNPVEKSDDIVLKATFYLGKDGVKKSNYLKELTGSLPPERDRREKDIHAWNEYLDWKNELTNLRIQALKYIAFSFDLDSKRKCISFLAVYDKPATLDKFSRLLRRNEISIFSNFYSTDRFHFRFNTENPQDYETGVYLEFLDMGLPFPLNDINIGKWNTIRQYSKQYRWSKTDKFQDYSLDDLQEQVKNAFGENALCVELSFSLSEYANDTMRQQMRQNGFLSDNIEEKLAEEYYSDGFIATSQVGDFALIKRLKRAVADYISGKSVSQGLEQWLFDIKKARPITELVPVKKWQNHSLNEKQRLAVQKILSAPDVCLIQGPPGTGKTTVIAEAIYQFVIQHKRVLVASQANLAVDNALERLIQNPRIRAIRLGNSKKFDDAVKNITEEHVLSNFYNTIVEYIDSEYLGKWDQLEDDLSDLNNDLSEVMEINTVINSLNQKKQHEQQRLTVAIGDFDLESTSRIISRYTGILNDIEDFTSFCLGKSDSLVMPEEQSLIVDLENSISPYVGILEGNGLKLSISDDSITSESQRLKTIISRTSLALDLIPKLESFDTSILENLKKQEQELLSFLAKDISIYETWRKTREQIEKLENESKESKLTNEEEGLFDIEIRRISDFAEQKRRIIEVLSKTKNELEYIIRLAVQVAEANKQVFMDRKSKLQERLNQYENATAEIRKNIEVINGNLNEKRECLLSFCDRYAQTAESLEDYLREQINNLNEKLYGTAKKEDWEYIFKGFKDWVNNIPDYKNEKAIYLDSYINGCNVVGVSCTENSRTLKDNGFDDFDVVIIDEVSKATPPELLIPMMKGKKVVLVGDHRQLPPLFNEHESSYQETLELQAEYDDVTVELKADDFEKYKQMVTSSLFQQYFESADPSIKETLTHQYRMHGDIMDLVNEFYDGLLVDGNKISKNGINKDHGIVIDSCLDTDMICQDKHAYWIDSSRLADQRVYEHRAEGSKSAANLVEAYIIVELLKKMELQYANDPKTANNPIDVGVISFYYEQVVLLRKLLQEESFHAIDVEINTVDRFQGKEKQVVLVSLVRNSAKTRHSTNSFIAAFQRINVAFSRAQNLLVIIGAKDMYVDQPVVITDLNNGEARTVKVYKEIIEKLNMRGAFFSADEVIPEQTVQSVLEEYRKIIGESKK